MQKGSQFLGMNWIRRWIRRPRKGISPCSKGSMKLSLAYRNPSLRESLSFSSWSSVWHSFMQQVTTADRRKRRQHAWRILLIHPVCRAAHRQNCPMTMGRLNGPMQHMAVRLGRTGKTDRKIHRRRIRLRRRWRRSRIRRPYKRFPSSQATPVHSDRRSLCLRPVGYTARDTRSPRNSGRMKRRSVNVRRNGTQRNA